MGRKKKGGVAILMSDKIDFKTKALKRDTEGHFIFLKGRIHQENINIINIYAPNIGAPKYMRKILQEFKGVIDSNTVILGDFNSPLSKINSSSKQNINTDIVALNNCLHQMHIYIYPFILKKQNTQGTQMHNTHGTFSKIDHIIGHKTSLNKFKNTEIISSIFTDHKGLKVATNPKENLQKHSDSWTLNSMLSNNEWVRNEIKDKIKKFLKANENERTAAQNSWDTDKAALRGKFIVVQAYL